MSHTMDLIRLLQETEAIALAFPFAECLCLSSTKQLAEQGSELRICL